MGVPKFFRWLSERYPLINKAVAESLPPDFGSLLIDRSIAELRVDNLYLDMNGIIHQCSHPADHDPLKPLSIDEMIVRSHSISCYD